MPYLRDHDWKIKYSLSDGNLLNIFYIPALKCAKRYDRSTGFFSAQALAAAVAGVEALVANKGKMKLIVGCTLQQREIEAIQRGEKLRDTVEAKLLACPFDRDDKATCDALELLAWMIANNCLEIKIGVPCDPETRLPVTDSSIFHEKSGIVEDAAGDRLVFFGSLNETLSGWAGRNWESFHVFCSWRADAGHLDEEENSFQRLWSNRDPAMQVLSLGEALQNRLLEFLPADDRLPKRLKTRKPEPEKIQEQEFEPTTNELEDIWRFIAEAPAKEPSGQWVGQATSAVVPWPHQEHAFRRMYEHWPPRLLIADEVGLGKTIQAGLLIRQAWLAGKARRILIMSPKAVLWQWQLELREKFNLNFPVYDGGKLHYYPSPALKGRHMADIGNDDWHRQPLLLVSCENMRRDERTRQLLDDAEPWDLIILDEAHHARRKGSSGDKLKDIPNQLLRLMRKLAHKTAGLILLTATPMQIHPVEVWDLLNLLGLPKSWTADKFLEFFRQTRHPAPDEATLNNVAALFRDVERLYQPLALEKARNIAGNFGKVTINRVLDALRDKSSIPRGRLNIGDRRLALSLARNHNPIKMLISRHTRELLRAYHKMGQLASNIATRQVEDIMVELSPKERLLYEAVEDYISSAYNRASEENRSSVGFVMTIYRRRLSSSFYALEQTLRNRLDNLSGKKTSRQFLDEDAPDDDLQEDSQDEKKLQRRERQALLEEEKSEIAWLLDEVKKLPTDTKAARLFAKIEQLKNSGYKQVIVFTQYTDSLDFLRSQVIRQKPDVPLLCFSGRGGERWQNGQWERISRDKTKEIFRKGEAEIMFCTDAAAEGLNFQFCGALINYDMPWNPMRVEQRIGRIDRLGQKYDEIKIVNFMYANTVEADIYQALRQRISLFGAFVGKLQPILARLPKTFEEITLAGGDRNQKVDKALEAMRDEMAASEENGFDLDEMNDSELTADENHNPAYDLRFLGNILASPAMLPPGHEAAPLTESGDYKYFFPGMEQPVRVTCDPDFYTEHAESVELWSPGSPVFPITPADQE